MPHKFIILFAGVAGFCCLARAAEPPGESAVKELKTDSRSPYVHRLTLYDEAGKAISPSDPAAPPYSPRTTCGKCHAYGEVSGGWHFSESHPDVWGGRPGEPWFLVDPQTGTALPVSGRGWPGTYSPADIALSNWQFVKRFGAHMPGGSYGEPDNAAVNASPEKMRWGVSGRREIDCMLCHAADGKYDPAEAAHQIEIENFRWAPTAALGLAVVRGEASKAPDDWEPDMPPDPDHPERTGPKLVWDKSRFDPDDRVLFDITRRIPNERCYFCHTVRQVGPGKPDDLVTSRDVHLAAGLLCVDCHREELVHQTTRGYATEAKETRQAWRAAFSCTGCHLGSDARPGEEEDEEEEEREHGNEMHAQSQSRPADMSSAEEGENEEEAGMAVRLGGRYAAPHPQHRGLPPVHFQKLTCTACHAGPWPEMDAQRFQTALAHGLGLATRDRTDDDPPQIVAPIFGIQPDGKIAPQRMVWPSFWARLNGEKVTPLLPDAVRKAAGKVLPKPAKEPAATPALTDDLIAKVLEALASEKGATGEPIYVRNGKGHRRDATGALAAFDLPAAAPYRWSLAHDVRPAAQALGVRACTDCHAGDGPLFWGGVNPAEQKNAPTSQPMVAFRGDEVDLARAWTFSFLFRPAFKVFGFACAALVTLILLRFVAEGFVGPACTRQRFLAIEWVCYLAGLAGVAILAVTGFIPKFAGSELREWMLLTHMLGAPLFIIGLTAAAIFWAPRCRFGGGAGHIRNALFWIALASGLVVVLTMLAAMVPIFGYAEQETLSEVHGNAGLVNVIAIILLIIATLAGRRPSKEVVRS